MNRGDKAGAASPARRLCPVCGRVVRASKYLGTTDVPGTLKPGERPASYSAGICECVKVAS